MDKPGYVDLYSDLGGRSKEIPRLQKENMKTIVECSNESTCQKRKVVCDLFCKEKLVARESNRCNPLGGQCFRLEIVSTEKEYPILSECNWTHAEIRAIESCRRDYPSSIPDKAVIYGHLFPCPACKNALHQAGVRTFVCMELPSC